MKFGDAAFVKLSYWRDPCEAVDNLDFEAEIAAYETEAGCED